MVKSNTNTSLVKEEILDTNMEAHQSVYLLPNSKQINQPTETGVVSVSSLEVPLKCSASAEDEFDTFSTIMKRFTMYGPDDPESLSDKPYSETLVKIFTVFQQDYGICQQLDSFESSSLPQISLEFLEPEIRTFIHSIVKNHSCQRYISTKMKEIRGRLDEAKRLNGYVRILKDFHISCKARTGQCSSVKKDASVKLISFRKSRTSHYSKANSKKLPAMSYGPLENSHVAHYRMVLMKSPVSLHRKKWSMKDEESLREGIEQQFQEMLLQKALELYSGPDDFCGDSSAFVKTIESIKDVESTPENMRSFLPKVDWQRLASMYVSDRPGAECEARWLNVVDPLVNKNPWTNTEEKKLLSIIQKLGLHNWIEIANTLNTSRTPFQCLARYQRSLNTHIIKQEWTEEDDAQLCQAVEACGEHDWQQVASKLERRTGSQCSNRWNKTLHPNRERVGRWAVEEDQHLKVAVTLFGAKNWNKIAQFVSGRTQVQCRERWVNVLDPSLNLQAWTEEEDSKLKAAIVEHGHCWSKIAAALAPRTDNQCRRRWKVILPHERPLLQTARRIQKSFFVSNFVDREEERPALSPGDFLPLPGSDAVLEADKGNNPEEQKKTARENPKSKKKREKKSLSTMSCKKDSRMENNLRDDEPISEFKKRTRKQRQPRKRSSEAPPLEELTIPPQPLDPVRTPRDMKLESVDQTCGMMEITHQTLLESGKGNIKVEESECIVSDVGLTPLDYFPCPESIIAHQPSKWIFSSSSVYDVKDGL